MGRDFRDADSLDEQQTGDLHRLYQSEWWTAGRSLHDVRQMLEHSDLVFAICENSTGRLVGFARVLTDTVFKALILDVIVAPDCRRDGLGRRLMERILNHPALREVRHFELYCLPELVAFYEQWGFSANLSDLAFMRRTRTGAA